MASEEEKKPLIRDIAGDDDDVEKTEIESLCVACEEMVSEIISRKVSRCEDPILSKEKKKKLQL